MQYRFLDPGDERLIEISEMPLEGIVAVAVRSTGYDTDSDEVLRLSLVDADGGELLAKTVKPQNKESWTASDATGGITPADVVDSEELYQYEEEISGYFENASLIVGQHMGFVEEVIESSWVTLPDYEQADLIALFCATHCMADYPGEPASVATLGGIAAYYGLEADESDTTPTARSVLSCYRALVNEHVEQRAAKGEDYWKRRDERLAEANAQNDAVDATARLREKRYNQMNGLLWVAACIIFVSLVIQLHQRGGDIGFIIICGAFAVFALIRAIANFRR